LTKLAKSQGISKLKVGGILGLDPRSVGQLDGATLPAALDVLQIAAGAPIALIVDEAQHALTGEMGEATMTALKSARDQMNSPGKVRLMLIMSGSDRDKLLYLKKLTTAEIIRKYGEPYFRELSGYTTFLWFRNRVFVGVRSDKVYRYGIFNPALFRSR
jgi:hypothetical protein